MDDSDNYFEAGTENADWRKEMNSGNGDYNTARIPQTHLAKEMLRGAAIEVLWHSITNAGNTLSPVYAVDEAAIFGGQGVIDTFGGLPRKSDFITRESDEPLQLIRRSPLGIAGELYVEHLRRGLTPEEAASETLNNAALKSGRPAQEPESNEGEAIDCALLTWGHRLRELMVPDRPMLVRIPTISKPIRLGPNTYYGGNWIYIISSTLNWITCGDTTVALVHPTIGRYLRIERDTGNMHIDCKIVATPPEEMSASDLLAALTLWEPDSKRAVYREFVDAYAAVKTL